ncbi:MAG: 50S ribosomal protein L24, partial [Desulfurococcales archaeon]|nr:50S ribosomal protein L24 [Desulfurococcales archaeon]
MSVKSKKPRKQRLAVYRAPNHKRKNLLTAPVSPELRAKYGIKRLTVRKGDTVKIMRGEWKNHEGKVVSVDYQKIAIHVDGVTIRKADGTPVYYPIHPSNVMIISLDLSDKKRRAIIERRTGKEVPEEVEAKEEELPKEEEKPSGE